MRVDVLYDSLATETRWFNSPSEGLKYAEEMELEDGVWDVLIDGEQMDVRNTK